MKHARLQHVIPLIHSIVDAALGGGSVCGALMSETRLIAGGWHPMTTLWDKAIGQRLVVVQPRPR